MIEKISVPLTEARSALTPNVVYADYGTYQLTMNIIQPFKGPTPPGEEETLGTGRSLPAILFFPGGGFAITDNAEKIPYLSYFFSRGYVVAVANYSLSHQAKFPTAVQDARSAVRFLRKNCRRFDIDPDRIAVIGDSAGGYLSMMVASCGEEAFFDNDMNTGVSSAVNAACSLFGPIDFLTLDTCEKAAPPADMPPLPPCSSADSFESKFLGAPLAEAPELCAKASVLSYAGKNNPPTIICHGDADCIVGIGQSKMLYDILTENGVDCDMYIVEGAVHDGHEFVQTQLLCRVADFFDAHM